MRELTEQKVLRVREWGIPNLGDQSGWGMGRREENGARWAGRGRHKVCHAEHTPVTYLYNKT